LNAAALLNLWMLSPTPMVVNDAFRLLLHTAHTQMPCTTSPVTYSKVSLTDGSSYGCTNKAQYDSNSVQSLQCRQTIKNSDCWLDCCYLKGASCCPVNLLPADVWQADDTWPQAPWDIACPTSTDEPAVQLKRHPTHQQCKTISTLQQPAPEAKKHIHANSQAQQESGEAYRTLPAH